MDKYSFIKDLTKQYLDGNLSKVKMEYEGSDSTIVDVVYHDGNPYAFIYRFEVTLSTRDITFIKHYCVYNSDEIKLKRDPQFEKAVLQYLFEH